MSPSMTPPCVGGGPLTYLGCSLCSLGMPLELEDPADISPTCPKDALGVEEGLVVTAVLVVSRDWVGDRD